MFKLLVPEAAVEGLLVTEVVFPAAFLITEWLGIVEWTTLLAVAGATAFVITLVSLVSAGTVG